MQVPTVDGTIIQNLSLKTAFLIPLSFICETSEMVRTISVEILFL